MELHVRVLEGLALSLSAEDAAELQALGQRFAGASRRGQGEPFIKDLGAWSLEAVCSDSCMWRRSGGEEASNHSL